MKNFGLLVCELIHWFDQSFKFFLFQFIKNYKIIADNNMKLVEKKILKLTLFVSISKNIVNNMGIRVIVNFNINIIKFFIIIFNCFLRFLILFFSSSLDEKIKKKSTYPNKNLTALFL